MKAEPRRQVPMRVQRDAALDLCATLMKRLGMVPVDMDVTWQLDHDPALARRPVDPETGEHIPHQHDRRYLVWLTREAHAEKTFGRPATTLGSDIGEIAKARRLTADQDAFRAALLRKEAGEPKVSTSRLRGRGFAPAKAQRRATGYRREQ